MELILTHRTRLKINRLFCVKIFDVHNRRNGIKEILEVYSVLWIFVSNSIVECCLNNIFGGVLIIELEYSCVYL